jgi:hypothetical protein
LRVFGTARGIEEAIEQVYLLRELIDPFAQAEGVRGQP